MVVVMMLLKEQARRRFWSDDDSLDACFSNAKKNWTPHKPQSSPKPVSKCW